MEYEFTSNNSNDASYEIMYTEVNREFNKDCNELPFFKCWAEKLLANANDHNCTKTCVPLVLDFLMDTIEHNIPKCTSDADDYCIFGPEGFESIYQAKSLCHKPCKIKGSVLDVAKFEEGALYQLGSEQVNVYFSVLRDIIMYKEYFIYDGIGMFGSIGGSLGLFVGFSLFDTFCLIVDVFISKLRLRSI